MDESKIGNKPKQRLKDSVVEINNFEVLNKNGKCFIR
jgi:hypothetical protein